MLENNPTLQFRCLAIVLLLAACAPKAAAPPPATTPAAPAKAPAPKRASDLTIAATEFAPPADATAALAAFRKSCPSLLKRIDRSGLSAPGDWEAACSNAATASNPQAFFRDNFRAVTIAGGEGFATGYFEPEIAGSRRPAPGFATPLYKRPPDLVEADLGLFSADLDGRKLRGRIVDNALVPYPDRAAIMAGALASKGLELAWAADPYDAFFLEIQGSGRLRLSDGSIMRIGYASQNGRPYVAIGKVLIDRGALPRGGANMDSILAWLRSHPAEAPAILAANPSVVFFRELTGEGPIGAMGVAVTPSVSVAADPAYIPLGAPLIVETSLPGGAPLTALMVAQDTGGAIKGPNRIDLFRGSGDKARAEAGAQAAKARITVLLPKTAG